MSVVSPDLLAQYNAVHEETLTRLLSLVNDPSWKQFDVKPDITIYTRADPNSSYNMAKGVVSIPVPVEVVYNKLKTVPKIDPSMPADVRDGTKEKYQFAEIPGDEHDSCFMYVGLESPSAMVTAREFLMYRRHYFVENKHIFLHVSVENDELKAPAKGYVRGKMIMQGYVIEEESGNTRLTFIAHADPAGWIPAMVYNSSVSNQCMIAKKVRDQILASK